MLRDCAFKPSWLLCFWLVAAHGAAIAALFVSNLPDWAAVGISLLLLINLLHGLWRDAGLFSPKSVVGLILDGQDSMLVHRDGARIPCAILSGSFVTPYLVVVHLAADSERRIVILPDNMDSQDFRRLRIWLKWGR